MTFNPGTHLLLKARVGSKAFGLANENSDDDYQGVFIRPTEDFLGVNSNPTLSYSYKNPDTTYHEVGKFCSLALKCNPTVLDMLWVENYNLRTNLGTELVNLRNNFLSRKYVKDAYFGYAVSQLGKLGKDDRPEKRAKNARHFMRLLHQGWELYSTGAYSVRLEDPDFYIYFGQRVGAAKDFNHAQKTLNAYRELFESETSALPEQPNPGPINDWLIGVRHGFFRQEHRDVATALG